MARKLFYNSLKLGFLPFISDWNSPDKIEYLTKTEQSAKSSGTQTEFGWDRIKRLLEIDEFGNVSHEANSVLQTASMSLLIGGIYGGTLQSKHAYEQFIRNNQATKFKTPLEAKQKLQEQVVLAFGKGAFKWGWRLALFSSTYVATSTLIQTYRGKYGIIEYVAAGAFTGFIYKLYSGPRAWIIGAGLGSVLGLVCGVVTTGILTMSGLSMQEARYWQYQWKESRNEAIRKGTEKYMAENDFAVIKLHDDEVGPSGKSLDNLDTDVNSEAKDKVKK